MIDSQLYKKWYRQEILNRYQSLYYILFLLLLFLLQFIPSIQLLLLLLYKIHHVASAVTVAIALGSSVPENDPSMMLLLTFILMMPHSGTCVT